MQGSRASSGAVADFARFASTLDERVKWFGTVRGRMGVLPRDGGFAYGKVEHAASYGWDSLPGGMATVAIDIDGVGLSCTTGTTCFAGSTNRIEPGWTWGGGLEYAASGNLTFKAEYLHVSLRSSSVSQIALMPPVGTVPASLNDNFDHTNFNVVRVGANQCFNAQLGLSWNHRRNLFCESSRTGRRGYAVWNGLTIAGSLAGSLIWSRGALAIFAII
jgi:opacity protein-like surface antigen